MSAADDGTPAAPVGPPASVRRVTEVPEGATRVVLVRHGEADCNVNGVVGGVAGCTGLTEVGVDQVRALAGRLERTGELAGVDALYASVLPRAVETAALLAPALDRWRDGPALAITERCDLCELHPGQGDGLVWAEFTKRFGEPRWEEDPTTPLAPGGESWSGFIERAAAAVTEVAEAHPGQLVVVACHAGVVEATLQSFLPLHRPAVRRGWIRTEHASLTIWERSAGQWCLVRYNDVTPVPGARGPA